MNPEPFHFPRKVQVQTVDSCNYRCGMCPYSLQARGTIATRYMDEGLFRQVLDSIAESGQRVRLCVMLQNEPLLDRRFLDLVTYAHDRTDAVESVASVTNGSILSDELLDRLTSLERFYLTVSVNATDGDRYRHVHGADGWERVHGRLARWTGVRSRVRVSCVVDAQSTDDARTFWNYWEALGYGVRLVPINSRANVMTVLAPIDSGWNFGHCHYPVDTLNVLVDGSVIVCCNDWRHEVVAGNVSSQSIEDIWNGLELKGMRRAAIVGTLRQIPLCSSCDYPMQSSTRVRLEAGITGGSTVAPIASGNVAAHATSVRLGSSVSPMLVWDVDADRGIVRGVMRNAPEKDEGAAALRLVIGQIGLFNFGSLDPVWCPGVLRSSGRWEGMSLVQMDLDTSCAAYRFARWYAADWAVA